MHFMNFAISNVCLRTYTHSHTHYYYLVPAIDCNALKNSIIYECLFNVKHYIFVHVLLIIETFKLKSVSENCRTVTKIWIMFNRNLRSVLCISYKLLIFTRFLTVYFFLY